MPNHKNLSEEPPDHAIGRSRGGLSTKIHQLCDGHGRPLVVLLGPGQGSDSRMFPPLLESLRVARTGPGRPRTTPEAVLGDKAYSSRGHRALLRARGSSPTQLLRLVLVEATVIGSSVERRRRLPSDGCLGPAVEQPDAAHT